LDLLFEKIDKSIALHQKNMDEANAFMGSVLNDVFGELEEKYGLDILSKSVNSPKKDIVDGPFGSNLKATEYIDSGTPIIRLQNIQRFQFIDKDIKFVSDEKAKQLQRHTFVSGDVVITKLGAPLGKSCIVPNFLNNGIIVADVIRVRVDESKSITKYINYSINSQIAINQFSDNSAGATRQRVKLTMVRDLKIPLPSLHIQQKVVKYLDEISQKIEKIKQAQKAKMNSLKALKASILDQAFKGEL
jgi:type I restriction enzyme S subunit